MCPSRHVSDLHVSYRRLCRVSNSSTLSTWQTMLTKRQSSQAKDEYPSSRDSRLLGICTGALAAAAISCAQSVFALIPLAVTSVVVAFRTGLSAAAAGRRATRLEQIESKSGFSRSWSLVAAGQAASQAVKEFSQRSVRTFACLSTKLVTLINMTRLGTSFDSQAFHQCSCTAWYYRYGPTFLTCKAHCV